MTRNLEHLRLGSAINAPIEKPVTPKTLYEILEDFINDNRDELILQIQRVESLNAIACFVSKDFDSDEPLGFNFLLRNDDSIELILDEPDDEEDVDEEDVIDAIARADRTTLDQLWKLLSEAKPEEKLTIAALAILHSDPTLRSLRFALYNCTNDGKPVAANKLLHRICENSAKIKFAVSILKKIQADSEGKITPPDCEFDNSLEKKNPEGLGIEIAGIKM